MAWASPKEAPDAATRTGLLEVNEHAADYRAGTVFAAALTWLELTQELRSRAWSKARKPKC